MHSPGNKDRQRQGICSKSIVSLLLFLGTALAGKSNFYPNAGGQGTGFGSGYGLNNDGQGLLQAPRYGAPSLSDPYSTLPRLGDFPTQAQAYGNPSPAQAYGKPNPAQAYGKPNPAQAYGKPSPYPANPYPATPYNQQHSSGKSPSNPYHGGDSDSKSNFYRKKSPNGFSNGGYKSQSSFQFHKQPVTCRGCSNQNPKLDGISAKAFPSIASPFSQGGLFGNNDVFSIFSSSPAQKGTVTRTSARQKPWVQRQRVVEGTSYRQRDNVPRSYPASGAGFPASSGYNNPTPGVDQRHPGQTHSNYQSPLVSRKTYKLNSPISPQPQQPGGYGSIPNSAGYFAPAASSPTYPGKPRAFRHAEVTGTVDGQRRLNAQNTHDKFADGDNFSKRNAFNIADGDFAQGKGGWDNSKQFRDGSSGRDAYSDRKRGGGQTGFRTRYDKAAGFDTGRRYPGPGYPSAYGSAAHNGFPQGNAGHAPAPHPVNQNYQYPVQG